MTDSLIEAAEPTFDSSGKYLYFLGSTDAGPVKNWFDQSNTDKQATSSVYLVTLAKSTPNPLLKESDEEPALETKDGPKIQEPPIRKLKDIRRLDNTTDTEQIDKIIKENEKILEENRKIVEDDQRKLKEDLEKSKKESETNSVVAIDFDGIAGRVVALPIESGHISNLSAGTDGQIYFYSFRGRSHTSGPGGPAACAWRASLRRFRLQDTRRGDSGRKHRRVPSLGRSQEDSLSIVQCARHADKPVQRTAGAACHGHCRCC